MQVTIIGAGSAQFSRVVMGDILTHERFKEGVTFSLMDVDREALDFGKALARSIAGTLKARVKVRATADRRRALAGSDFVVVTIKSARSGMDLIERDREIALRYGLRQTVADTVGIGGIFYGLRHMPILLDIGRDMEQICPDAVMLNHTNPMAMISLALQRDARIRMVGLCHGVQGTSSRLRLFASLSRLGRKDLRALLGSNRYPMHYPYIPPKLQGFMADPKCMIPAEEWHTLTAGINHMAAFLKLEWRGQDAYPMIRRAAQHEEIRLLEPTRFDMFDRLGYFFTESSPHMSEYVPHFMRHPGELRRLKVFKRPPQECTESWTRDRLRESLRKGELVVEPDRVASNEYTSQIIHAMVSDEPIVINGNVHNRGGKLIANLPGDSCVEVPCLVNRSGIQPTTVGELPPQVAAMIRTNISVQDLTVRAVLEENRQHVYHAAMMDPNAAATLTLPKLWCMVDELLEANRGDIPRALSPSR